MNRRSMVLGFALLLSAPRALAQATVAPPPATPATDAHSLFQQALIAIENDDPEGARKKFAESYAKDPAPKTLLNLALIEIRCPGHRVEARAHLRAFMADPSTPRERIAQLEKDVMPGLLAEIGQLKIEAPPRTVVTVDGKRVEAGGLVDVEVGGHHVEARDGERVAIRDVEARRGGGLVTVRLALPPARLPGSGLSGPGDSAMPGDGAEEPSRGRFWGWRAYAGVGAAAAGAVLIGVGAGFKIDQAHQESVIANTEPALPPGNGCAGVTTGPCAEHRDATHARNSDSENGLYTLTAGIALVAVGGALLAWSALAPSRNTPRRVSLVPSLNGVLVHGAF